MKKVRNMKSSHWLRVAVVVFLLLFVCVYCRFETTSAAEKYTKVRTLKKKKSYRLDLNGGKKETVRYQIKKVKNKYGEYDHIFQLYVNGKRAYQKRFSDTWYSIDRVRYLDIKKSDRYKELILDISGSESNWSVMVLRYYNAKKIKTYRSSNWRISTDGIRNTGNNRFYLEDDTPFYSNTFGCYYVRMPSKLAGNKIRPVKQSTYQLMNVSDYVKNVFGGKYYVLNRPMEFYPAAKRKNAKDTLYYGTEFTPQQIKPTGRKANGLYNLFVKVKLRDGRKGWLYFPADKADGWEYLTQMPGWG